MASPRSPDSDQEDDSDLRARVERLERALEALRAEVKQLRSVAADEGSGTLREAGEGKEEPSKPAKAAPAEGETVGEGLSPDTQDSAPEGEDERSPEPVSAAPSASGPAAAAPRAFGDAGGPSSRSPSAADRMLDRLVSWAGLSSEDWLNYVGIGLLLFGLAFLFKYSVEQGWLVPVIRVGFGVALGSVLLVAGLRIYDTRRRLRQVLLGGSSATFYATVFAAYQLYGLVSYLVAFASMVVVTVATIGLAVQQDESSLAIIGTIGGLGTPFLIYSPAGSVAGLAVYTCTILVGACAIFLVRGWQSLLYTTVVGGWVVFLVAAFRAGVLGSRPPDAWALQVGIGGAWGLLAGTPVLRVLFRRQHPDRWPGAPLPSWIDRWLGTDRPAYGLVTASPFLALAASHLLWEATDGVWAAVAGVGAVVYAGAHAGLRRASLPRYAPVHGLVAAVLAAYGLAEALDGSALLVAWGVEVLLLLGVARRLDAAELRVAAHALFVVVTGMLVGRIGTVDPEAARILRPAVLSELVVLALVAGASVFVRRRWLRWTYRGVVLAGWLGWWASELAPVAHGQAYVSGVWGVTAAALLVGGAWADRRPVQIGGLATLALFVAKLFLVDLASLPALWRIGLFLGFGAAFLAISYLLPGLVVGPLDRAETRGGESAASVSEVSDA